MTANDGHDGWRAAESRALSDLVQKRLRALQNPEDCSKAKKLVCKLNKGCGYGCQIHHAVYCFIVAYGTERTLILKSKGWRYNKGGFEEIFMPLSETCNDPKASTNMLKTSSTPMLSFYSCVVIFLVSQSFLTLSQLRILGFER